MNENYYQRELLLCALRKKELNESAVISRFLESRVSVAGTCG